MPDTEQHFLTWIEELEQYRLPRWEELPDIELYMDQVITLIERYLSPLVGQSDSRVITSAMINNYVKLNVMPKPRKKKYERIHLSYLIVITILKQVLLIPEIKEGIFLQTEIDGMSTAYDSFCQELEDALHAMIEKYQCWATGTVPAPAEQVPLERLGLQMACISFASKIFTQKIIVLHAQGHTHTELQTDSRPNSTEKKVQ